jgi:hypothetical protein
MKPLRTSLLALLLIGAAVAAHDTSTSAAAGTTALRQSSPAPGDYNVALDVSQGSGFSTWTYTVTRARSTAKEIPYFTIDFGSCGDQSPTVANIVSATVNGMDWSNHLSSSGGTTGGCDIPGANVVKFDSLPNVASYVIVFTLNDNYPPMDTAVWLRTSTSCLKKAALGPGCKGYTRTTTMDADPSLAGKLYNDINTYMRTFGFDYTENPNCTGGFGGDINGVHAAAEVDPYYNRYVFRFDIHIDPIMDGDRCSSSTVDRQRNEMKSITNNTTWAKVQGNWDEWQILEWKFKIPAGYQPTSSFTHIHQLKAQDGPNNGSAVITITPRASSNGSNKRIQIIHSVDGANTGKGTIVDNIPLSAFEDQWVQVREEVHYNHAGSYACTITRISDGQVLVNFRDDNIDMWRIGSSYIRNKFGIYRSLAGGHLDQNPVGQSPLLKNESLFLRDFRIYEKNTNPTPGLPHD